MMFLGNLCGGLNSVQYTKNCIENISYVELKNGVFNDLYISKNPEFDYLSLGYIWDFDTVLYAPFENSTSAGNVDFGLDTTSHMLIKRRKEGEFAWQTILVKEINVIGDFDIVGIDYTARSGIKYEYASVPVQSGIEGSYSIMSVDSNFDKIFLVEKDKIIGTDLSDGYCDTSRQTPSNVYPILNHKYPSYIRNNISNYDTGSVSASFLQILNKDYIVNDSKRIPYQREIMDFLTDGRPKLLKHWDGRMWLIMVVGSPTDSANGHYANRYFNFEWVEVGDCESEEDLYYANLSDITEEWWIK